MLRINNRTYPLVYNGGAMFGIRERYGRDALNLLRSNTPEGVQCLLGTTLILAEQGELLRRYYGYRPAEMLTDKDVESITNPLDLLRLRTVVLEQIVGDTRRAIEPEQQDTDLGLLELQQKKEADSGRLHYLHAGLLVGLDARETMLLPVGTVCDLLELYIQAHTRRKD